MARRDGPAAAARPGAPGQGGPVAAPAAGLPAGPRAGGRPRAGAWAVTDDRARPTRKLAELATAPLDSRLFAVVVASASDGTTYRVGDRPLTTDDLATLIAALPEVDERPVLVTDKPVSRDDG